jgi:MFS family permease
MPTGAISRMISGEHHEPTRQLPLNTSHSASPMSRVYYRRHISYQLPPYSNRFRHDVDGHDTCHLFQSSAFYKQPRRAQSASGEVGCEKNIPSPTNSSAVRAFTQSPPWSFHMSPPRETLFVAVVALAHFMTQCSLGQTLVPLEVIGQTLKANAEQSIWFVAGYSLTVGTFILISGRAGDILGHKRVFCFGWAWFGLWSTLVGFSGLPSVRSQIFFDICRALQGIGPAIIMPTGLSLFGLAYPPGIKKNIMFSVFGALAPAGFVCGAVFGSLFASVGRWNWAFWSFALICWALGALAMVVIPSELSLPNSMGLTFDWAGSFLGVTGLITFNVAWNCAPMYGWGSTRVIVLLVLGILVLGTFFWVEKSTKNPILPIQALDSTAVLVLGCVGLGWGSFGIWVFYTFRFLQNPHIRNYTLLQSAAAFAPAPISGLLAAGLTGFLLTHTPVSFTMMLSMFAFFIGIVIAATQPAHHQSYWAQIFISVLIMPFGMDMSFPAASVILSNRMPPEHQGIAMSLVNTCLNYFISISLGIAGTIEVHVAKDLKTHPTDPYVLMKDYRATYHTAIALSSLGLTLGISFFIRDFLREGWKPMKH